MENKFTLLYLGLNLLKNYFILGIIIASSIFIVLYINKLYLSTKNNDNILNGFIKEIKTQEIDNYIIENPNFIIYLGYKNNDNKSFEKKFKKSGNSIRDFL